MIAKRIIARLLLVFCAVTMNCQAQGTFQNLDFESASVFSLPSGQFEFVSSTNGLPGWTCFYGSTATAQVTHNAFTVGAANIGVLGPNYASSVQIISGQYSAVLQPGGSPTNASVIVPATIAQQGLIPPSANSLQIKTTPGLNPDYFSVELGGQVIPMVLLQTTGNYSLFGGNIAAFADSIADLRITSLAVNYGPNSGFGVDDIVFSAQSIPEPNVIALFGFAALLLGCRRKNSRDR